MIFKQKKLYLNALLVFSTIIATKSSLEALPITADFTDDGTFISASVVDGILTVTGSADVNVLNLNGLGIVGGSSNSVIDGSESITFSFAQPVIDVSYFVTVAGQIGGTALLGEAQVEAFDLFNASLGTMNVNSTGSMDISGLGQPISKFTVTALVDTHRISTVTYTPVPEPASSLLVSSALLGAIASRRCKT